ncbi:hypothetical protein HOS53_gp209 [Klebsiella phage May]|uniref:Uncharacterized protein n=1 Tax=Klebsiella phage May TaxID=2054272 RepID=A0A2H5BNN4_9CAUD|nr:hypothetical protein HOS53_gp209 [Klebsiella phage May]AUG87951.1 hypothetical protein CPT_May_037 [Klebsiella phage May]
MGIRQTLRCEPRTWRLVLKQVFVLVVCGFAGF